MRRVMLIAGLIFLLSNILFAGRYYDAASGRFLQVDPLAKKYPSLSPYNYVANNPLKYIDPNGKEIVPVGAMVKIHSTLMNKSESYRTTVNRVNERLGDLKVPMKAKAVKEIRSYSDSQTGVKGKSIANGVLKLGLDKKKHVKVEGTEIWVGKKEEIATLGKQDVYTTTAEEFKHLDQLTENPEEFEESLRKDAKKPHDDRKLEKEANEFQDKVRNELYND